MTYCENFANLPERSLAGYHTPLTHDARSQVGKVGLPPLDRLDWLEASRRAGASPPDPYLPSFLDALMSPPLLSLCDSLFILIGEGSSLRKLEGFALI